LKVGKDIKNQPRKKSATIRGILIALREAENWRNVTLDVTSHKRIPPYVGIPTRSMDEVSVVIRRYQVYIPSRLLQLHKNNPRRINLLVSGLL
jgi:hypothetical protein